MTSVGCVAYTTGTTALLYVMQLESKHGYRTNTSSCDVYGTTRLHRSFPSPFQSCVRNQQRLQSGKHVTFYVGAFHYSV